ncbi:hypothetical protein C8F01DRAFT_1234671 [Mycena amicta]|nr:hypothetical protein C8F01DRAFT_1234671 [Mycena amicta]
MPPHHSPGVIKVCLNPEVSSGIRFLYVGLLNLKLVADSQQMARWIAFNVQAPNLGLLVDSLDLDTVEALNYLQVAGFSGPIPTKQAFSLSTRHADGAAHLRSPSSSREPSTQTAKEWARIRLTDYHRATAATAGGRVHETRSGIKSMPLMAFWRETSSVVQNFTPHTARARTTFERAGFRMLHLSLLLLIAEVAASASDFTLDPGVFSICTPDVFIRGPKLPVSVMPCLFKFRTRSFFTSSSAAAARAPLAAAVPGPGLLYASRQCLGGGGRAGPRPLSASSASGTYLTVDTYTWLLNSVGPLQVISIPAQAQSIQQVIISLTGSTRQDQCDSESATVRHRYLQMSPGDNYHGKAPAHDMHDPDFSGESLAQYANTPSLPSADPSRAWASPASLTSSSAGSSPVHRAPLLCAHPNTGKANRLVNPTCAAYYVTAAGRTIMRPSNKRKRNLQPVSQSQIVARVQANSSSRLSKELDLLLEQLRPGPWNRRLNCTNLKAVETSCTDLDAGAKKNVLTKSSYRTTIFALQARPRSATVKTSYSFVQQESSIDPKCCFRTLYAPLAMGF